MKKAGRQSTRLPDTIVYSFILKGKCSIVNEKIHYFTVLSLHLDKFAGIFSG